LYSVQNSVFGFYYLASIQRTASWDNSFPLCFNSPPAPKAANPQYPLWTGTNEKYPFSSAYITVAVLSFCNSPTNLEFLVYNPEPVFKFY